MHRLIVLSVVLLACFSVFPASAADNPYAVSGIKVEASGASSTEAQATAINSGRVKAWDKLYARLTRPQDADKKPQLDDLALQRLVSSYTVENDRRSTTRYAASVTYTFNADAVRRLLRSQNIAYADLATNPSLIIPMAPNYSVHGAWTSVWANPKYTHGTPPLALPLGDGIDAGALTGLNFDAVSWNDIQPVASRVNASEAYLVLANQSGSNVALRIRRLGPGVSPPIPDIQVSTAGAPAGQALSKAADAAAQAIADAWKMRSAINFNQKSTLVAEMNISSLESWAAMQKTLSSIPLVTDVQVLAMNMGEVRMQLTYAGSAEQLNDLLSQSHVDMVSRGGMWWLAPAAVNSDAGGVMNSGAPDSRSHAGAGPGAGLQ